MKKARASTMAAWPELRTVPLVAGPAVVVASNVNVRGQAKPYQIKQFLNLVERYNLKLED